MVQTISQGYIMSTDAELIERIDRQIGATGLEANSLRFLANNPKDPNPRLLPEHIGENVLWMEELRAVLVDASTRLAALSPTQEKQPAAVLADGQCDHPGIGEPPSKECTVIKQRDNLGMMVMRLCARLRKFDPDTKVYNQAVDLLKRYGIGSPLRDSGDHPVSEEAP